jgi:hypothetical protein
MSLDVGIENEGSRGDDGCEDQSQWVNVGSHEWRRKLV